MTIWNDNGSGIEKDTEQIINPETLQVYVNI